MRCLAAAVNDLGSGKHAWPRWWLTETTRWSESSAARDDHETQYIWAIAPCEHALFVPQTLSNASFIVPLMYDTRHPRATVAKG